ncbi:hypothetical protein AAG570_005027 [Ranatra chinensis]|uniref:Proteasome adapter and scaffold protein ECM29 HEAT-repeat domain-containing protein n=1 Tax=Ranatra chinensis TaxID=642074 RepID=A0ABD0YMV6_9HEMI
MVFKRRNMFCENKKQETTEIELTVIDLILHVLFWRSLRPFYYGHRAVAPTYPRGTVYTLLECVGTTFKGAVQEAAGKGLALVYQTTGDSAAKSELLAKVVEQLTVGKRSVNLVAEDTKLFEEGELGKAPTGENLSTYKELCSLASDLNQPDLIYKFMHLANHNAIWNSKKGAAYGVSSLVSMAGSDMDEYLPKIVAKLYRYQYDPTPQVQQTMATIWTSLTANCTNTFVGAVRQTVVTQTMTEKALLKMAISRNRFGPTDSKQETTDHGQSGALLAVYTAQSRGLRTLPWGTETDSFTIKVEKYHKEIFDDLLNNLTSSMWRVRISCCEALADFIRGGGGKIFEDCQDKIPELWKQLFRVMDDFHMGTREAAVNTAKVLSKICIRHCEKEVGRKSNRISVLILPVLLQVGIKHNVSEVRAVSIKTVSEIVKNGVSPELITQIVPALLVAAAELESATLNELSVMYSASRHAQDAIDSARASAVKSHFTATTLTRCVQYVKPEMLEELAPQMVDMLKTSVGLGSRITTADFLILLAHHLTVEEIQPYIGKFLGALLNGLTDRNSAIRKTYATTIGELTRYAKDSSVDRLIAKLKNLYFEREDDSSKNAVCHTLRAMVNYSQDSVKNRPDLVLPLVFFAKHQEKKQGKDLAELAGRGITTKVNEIDPKDGSNKSILDTWEEVWEDVCGTQGILKQNEEPICQTLEATIQSQSWQNKAQAARAIKTLASKLGDGMSEDWRDRLVTMLVGGLAGRTWDGKEALLDALASVCKSSKSTLNNNTQNAIVEAVLKECGREKMKYRCYALRSLADILQSLEIDKFETVYPILTAIIEKDVKTEISADGKDETVEAREELSTLKNTAYETLGKSWPTTQTTQEKYREAVVEECVSRLTRSTRQVQVTIMSTLVLVVEKLTLLGAGREPLGAEDRGALSRILQSVNNALVHCLGISKHTNLRKEALNLLFTLAKHLKGISPEEYRRVEEIFANFSEEISRDSAPEIKSRFIDIKETFKSQSL